MARVTGCREAVPVVKLSATEVGVNWWLNKNLSERNAYMLENEIEMDITFIFRQTENHKEKGHIDDEDFVDCPTSHSNSAPSELSETNDSIQILNDRSFEEPAGSNIEVLNPETTQIAVCAHKYMLLSASSVFWNMLSGLHDTDEVTIEDVDVDTFRLMLRFIYTDETNINNETVIPLLNASRRYDLSTLIERCTTWLSDHVTPESACVLLQKSKELNQENLCLQCLKIIQNHTDTAFESSGFGDLSQESLSYILNSDVLSIKEVQVFHYCSVWATNKLVTAGESLSGANIRKKLGPILYKIRFPTLSMDDFTSIIIPTNVLSKEDELTIFRCLSNSLDSQSELKFETRPRRTPEVKKVSSTAIALPMPPPKSSSEECLELVPIDVEGSNSDNDDNEENDETKPKVIWSSGPSTSKTKTKLPPPPGSRYLQISKPDVGRLKQQYCVPPTEFEVTVCALENAFLVNGFTVGAPVLNSVYESVSDPSAPPQLDLPLLSIVNVTGNETLLRQHFIESRDVKIQDGVAYVNIKTSPFWLLPKEKTIINVVYNLSEELKNSKAGGSLFKKVLNYASKAMKTNHYSCRVQTLSGQYMLSNDGKTRIQLKGSPDSPILGLLCENP